MSVNAYDPTTDSLILLAAGKKDSRSTLTVTTEMDQLIGETVTVTDNKETLTSTFSSYKTAIFKLSNIGTYTITCGSLSETVVNESKGSNLTVELGIDLVSWTNGTDEEIAAMLDAYYNGILSLEDIQDVWSVGDERVVSLSAMSNTFGEKGETHRAQDIIMTIIDFNHDALETPINGITKALITIHQKTYLMDAECAAGTRYGEDNTENGFMNNADADNVSWKGCARRTWCNNTYYNALPSSFKSMVKDTIHSTTVGHGSTSLENTIDKVFLLSEYEIFGQTKRAAAQEGEQYAYYMTSANRLKTPPYASNYASHMWYERSPYKVYINDFWPWCMVYVNGNADFAGSTIASIYLSHNHDVVGIVPAMCL